MKFLKSLDSNLVSILGKKKTKELNNLLLEVIDHFKISEAELLFNIAYIKLPT